MFKPMLAQLGTVKDLEKKGMIFEPKLDGTRCLLQKSNSALQLINRRGRNITARYPEFDFAKNIKAKSAVLDGEIIVYDEKGLPDFNLLQSREQLEKKILIELRAKQHPATYVVFDILAMDGRDLTRLPLSRRKIVLEKIIKPNKNLQLIFSTHKGKRLWQQIRKLKLEGVMAKSSDSQYFQGIRSKAWLKIKNLKTIDCVIVGYSAEKRRLSALVLANYYQNKLLYIGRVGTGFSEQMIEQLHKRLSRLKQAAIPVPNPPEDWKKHNISWTKPLLVCEVQYLELTKGLELRAPSFQRLRLDKEPAECVLEEQVKL